MKAEISGTEVVTPDDALGYARRSFSGDEAETRQIEVAHTGAGIVGGLYMPNIWKIWINCNPQKVTV